MNIITYSEVRTFKKATTLVIMFLVLFCFSIIGCSQSDRVNGLIQKLKDEELRVETVDALIKIGKPAVEPLIVALKDEDSIVRKEAAESLGGIGDGRAVEPLIVALKDEDSGVRVNAAHALGVIGDARAVEPLIEASNDEATLEVIVGDYDTFIRIGKPGTETFLIDVLYNYGTKSMAEDFLNCGNIQLEEAARKWAKENGYQITTRSGGASVRWGSDQ